MGKRGGMFDRIDSVAELRRQMKVRVRNMGLAERRVFRGATRLRSFVNF